MSSGLIASRALMLVEFLNQLPQCFPRHQEVSFVFCVTLVDSHRNQLPISIVGCYEKQTLLYLSFNDLLAFVYLRMYGGETKLAGNFLCTPYLIEYYVG